MSFQLDTSGDVGPMPAGPMNERFLRWTDLNTFTQGYVEELFASSAGHMEADDGAMVPWPVWAFSDLAPETLARVIDDCARYMSRFQNSKGSDGAYFWDTRQVGGYASFPPLTVSLGDDGKVYFQ